MAIFLQLNIIRAKWWRLQAQKNITPSFYTAFHSWWVWPFVCTGVNNDSLFKYDLGNWFPRWRRKQYFTNGKLFVLQCISTPDPLPLFGKEAFSFQKNTNVCSVIEMMNVWEKIKNYGGLSVSHVSLLWERNRRHQASLQVHKTMKTYLVWSFQKCLERQLRKPWLWDHDMVHGGIIRARYNAEEYSALRGLLSLEHHWEDMSAHESYKEECSTGGVSIFNSQLSYNIFPGMAAARTAMSQITNLSHNLYVWDMRLLGFLNFQVALDEATCHDLTVSWISLLFSFRLMICLIIPVVCLCLVCCFVQYLPR